MLEIINDVITALNKVGKRFYSIEDFYFKNGEIVNGGNFRHLELRFMHEFSAQFSRGFEDNSAYQKLEYDFEIPKKFIWSETANIAISTTYEQLQHKRGHDKSDLDYLTTIPDFLVHAGQHDKKTENQKLIIEAKLNPRTPKCEVFKDIFHTFIYSNEYEFQCSIMLLVHFNKERWIKLLTEYIKAGYYSGSSENTKKIFVIFKGSYDEKAEFFSLHELLYAPLCPVCQEIMLIKMATQGFNAGNNFWGCRRFPDCTGSRPLKKDY
ncbi:MULTISPECIES: hypothetical protein [unclassified Aeromonas]|uniref:hypothetical protein n=1 Tax=unclassified Aeromonas TaxID=257493 RepID=UPI00084AF45A|nr:MULTISPECIES: hypothetical protein [unclassified Aeromonas]OEC55831.1 hypothetical protein A9G04_08970 [Aeromonas sp. ANNP30]OEC65653.1 hypothetical protein A9G49_08705 [Aeromonas sp. ANP5]